MARRPGLPEACGAGPTAARQRGHIETRTGCPARRRRIPKPPREYPGAHHRAAGRAPLTGQHARAVRHRARESTARASGTQT